MFTGTATNRDERLFDDRCCHDGVAPRRCARTLRGGPPRYRRLALPQAQRADGRWLFHFPNDIFARGGTANATCPRSLRAHLPVGSGRARPHHDVRARGAGAWRDGRLACLGRENIAQATGARASFVAEWRKGLRKGLSSGQRRALVDALADKSNAAFSLAPSASAHADSPLPPCSYA